MNFDEAWSALGGELVSHPDAPDLYRLEELRQACECFYEIGKLAGIDRENILVDTAVLTAIAEVRQQFRSR